MPEPPKVANRRPRKRRPPRANAPRAIARWESTLAAHLERFKRYPSEARARGDQGIATVACTIDHEGRLVSSRIAHSSGSATLDQETLAMLVRANSPGRSRGHSKSEPATDSAGLPFPNAEALQADHIGWERPQQVSWPPMSRRGSRLVLQ
jgi:TonB family protein